MVSFCAVVGCSNRGDRERGISFFRLPSVQTRRGEKDKKLSKERRQQWKRLIHRADLNEEKCRFARVCSEHFLSGKPSKLYETDSPDWAPSLNMGYDMSLNGPTGEPHPKTYGRKVLADSSTPESLPGDQPADDDFCANGSDASHVQNDHIEVSESTNGGEEMASVAETERKEISAEEALAQESTCDKVWKDLFGDNSSFRSFQQFREIFQKYQDTTYSVYKISDCNRVETANFKRKVKLSSSLKYASVSFCCALFGHQRSRGKNIPKQNCRWQSCPSFIRLTSSSRDQQLRIVETNLVHNHKLDQESFQRFHQAKKMQQDITKDELLVALSSVEVIIEEDQGGCDSPTPSDLSSSQKQQLCSDVTGSIGSKVVQMEIEDFHKWTAILADLLHKMEMDANCEASREKRKRNRNGSCSQNKRRIGKLETCDTDKEVCNSCKKHEPPKRVCRTRVIEWIDCDGCSKWYHRACLPSVPDSKSYKCADCLPRQA